MLFVDDGNNSAQIGSNKMVLLSVFKNIFGQQFPCFFSVNFGEYFRNIIGVLYIFTIIKRGSEVLIDLICDIFIFRVNKIIRDGFVDFFLELVFIDFSIFSFIDILGHYFLSLSYFNVKGFKLKIFVDSHCNFF